MHRTTFGALALVSAILVGACGGASGPSAATSPTAPSSVVQTVQTVQTGTCSPPNAPANLVVTAIDTRVTLTWSAVSGITEYIVLIGSAASNSNELLTNTTNTTYQWNGAALGQHYARILAKNTCGTSGSSNEVAFRVTSTTTGG
jgi:hypothetical protein